MSWESLFGTVNLVATVAWIGLVLLPRWPALLAACLYAGVGLLCLVYTAGFISVLGGFVDPVGPAVSDASFSSIEGVRAIFASNGGVTIGWTHYLAFDLFVGIWIARDADAKADSARAAGAQTRSLELAAFAGLAGFAWHDATQ